MFTEGQNLIDAARPGGCRQPLIQGIVAIEHRGSAFHTKENFRLGIGDVFYGVEKFDMGCFNGGDDRHMRPDHA